MVELTPGEMAELAGLRDAAVNNPQDVGARTAYYDYLAGKGDQYGKLAKDVVDTSTLNGHVANQYLTQQAERH